ncbi:hypothetical protein MNBD_GAMMA19-952 [hydrothermal vent metagenome]|uniref:Uncharacterized protein n=1 Tax=hydrothermal vent metagenome TaxID=652676 RepID=A0A3B1AHZ8_9ZZZZ
MLTLKKSLVLFACLLFGVLANCGLTGKTMKLTDFFNPDMVELIRAIEKGDENKARVLIEQGLSLNVHGEEGITPLFWLIMQKDKPAIRLAIKLGANPSFADLNGDTPVTMVTGGNDDELLLILLEGGGNANAVDSDGHPAIFAAVAGERVEQIKMLMRFGADINLTNRSGANSALYGADINRFEMVHYLIEQGVDYAARDATRGDIAWSVHNKLSKNLLSPEYPAYGWALKVKQQLIDRGVKFPPLSPREVRWKEGKPNKYDIKAREKERLENNGQGN